MVIRLYSKKRGQGYMHEYQIKDLEDKTVLRQFLLLLHADRLIAPPPANSVVDELLAKTSTEEKAITRRFYAFFSNLRLNLFQQLVEANPEKPTEVGLRQEDTASQVALLSAAQKILDRILFICFCEDTGLLPHNIIHRAFEAAGTGFVTTTRWQQLCGLFRAVDQGNPPMGIPGYNGGLFRRDDRLDALTVPDEALNDCLNLSDYDFHTEVNVNILGHIFEQSISDLEAMRAEILGQAVDKRQSKRKQEGVFYTPEYITRYIVENTVGAWLEKQFAALNAKHDPDSIPDSHHHKKQTAAIALWEAYQNVLRGIKIVDPACGSGAFLIAAFDFLHAEYTRVNDTLTELRGGQPELFDLDKLILQQNLYGVDLNPESVEITKLALWLKTARADRPLNDLDGNIKCGNSLTTPHPDVPADLADRAFDWHAEFPQVFGCSHKSTPGSGCSRSPTSDLGFPAACSFAEATEDRLVTSSPSHSSPALDTRQSASGGFDVVIGNPPYIRQEWLAPYKPGFQREFACYSGTADAYLYFFERGLDILQPDGRLGFITSGSFNNAKFAKPFRKWLPTVGRFTHVVNFGENQPFEDAEMVYPTISIIRKMRTSNIQRPTSNVESPEHTISAHGQANQDRPGETDLPENVTMSLRYYFMSGKIPESIPEAVASEGIDCDDTVYGQAEWRFQPAPVTALFNRLMNAGKPLGKVVGKRIYYGVKTGLNEAFVIDQSTRDRLIVEDPGCADMIKPMLRGEDVRPWYYKRPKCWLIFMPSGFTSARSGKTGQQDCWQWLCENHSSLAKHLESFEEPARKRKNQGECWWELAVGASSFFESPKIYWPEIAKLPRFCFDDSCVYSNNKNYVISEPEPWLLAVLQSRPIWFTISQMCTPLRLRGGLWQYQCFKQFFERLPIPDVSEPDQEALAEFAKAATATARKRYALHEKVRHRIQTDLDDGTHKLNQKLDSWWDLDFRGFRKEVKKAFKSDIPLSERADWEAALATWQSEHQSLTTRLFDTETAINDRVYALFHLTPAERQTLADHMEKAMIDYPFGEV
ncbi:MAG: DNA methyltransferase [Lentisphaeria bacterium]|nr:DNA methyltransferase [Lentisphaeria bacterium]